METILLVRWRINYLLSELLLFFQPLPLSYHILHLTYSVTVTAGSSRAKIEFLYFISSSRKASEIMKILP
jgi:hypothetical protein